MSMRPRTLEFLRVVPGGNLFRCGSAELWFISRSAARDFSVIHGLRLVLP